jgi:hypothetical protein
MIASTLLRFAKVPFLRLVSTQSDAKLFATSANWLAGRPCKPPDSGHLNPNSNDVRAGLVMV